jgi:hypothetical protein
MERLKNKIEETGSHLYELYETEMELKKLQAIRKSAEAFSASAAGLAVLFVFFFVIVFASIAGAYAIAAWAGRAYVGFLAMTGFYLILGLLLLKFKDRWIKTPLMNNMIKNFFNNEQ